MNPSVLDRARCEYYERFPNYEQPKEKRNIVKILLVGGVRIFSDELELGKTYYTKTHVGEGFFKILAIFDQYYLARKVYSSKVDENGYKVVYCGSLKITLDKNPRFFPKYDDKFPTNFFKKRENEKYKKRMKRPL